MFRMKFIELKKHLAEGQLLPCYLVTGEDNYIILKAVESFRASVGAMTDFNLSCFFENYRSSDLIAALNALPMMGGHVIVIARNFNDSAKDILAYLKNPAPHSSLVIVSPTIPKPLAALAKIATIVDCDRLEESAIRRWVIKRASDNGSSIGESAAERLCAYCECFMSRIESEIDKLSFYRHGGRIELSDVDELVNKNSEFKIYELGDAIVSGRGEAALLALESIIDSTSSGYVISGLYGYFRRLLYSVITTDNRTAEYLGVKEFAVVACKRQAQSVSPKRLKAICDRLQRADFDFKCGRINDELAATTIVAQTVFEIATTPR